jgi:hypothetical protein
MPPLYHWGGRRAFHSRVILWLWPHSAQNRRTHRYVEFLDEVCTILISKHCGVCARANSLCDEVRVAIVVFKFEQGFLAVLLKQTAQ